MKITIKKQYVEKYKKGYPVLLNDFLEEEFNEEEEGGTVHLIDPKHQYVATAYIGKQNKGLGWVYTNNRRQDFDDHFVKDKINDAVEARKKFFNNDSTNAFRIFNSFGDGIGGLTIDYLDGFLLINWYNKGIIQKKEVIIQTLLSAVNPKGIYQKARFKSTDEAVNKTHIYGAIAPEDFTIKEHNVNYCVNLDDGDMVGVFLDQRELRRLLTTDFSENKTVLNTFSYTGVLSVATLFGQASETTSVDLAKRSKEKTEANFVANKINPAEQKIVVDDVFNFFKYAKRKELKYDMVIVDPPSFAKSKKRTFSVHKDYTNLILDVLPLVTPHGYIIASTNNSKLSLINFKKMIKDALIPSGRDFNMEKVFRLPKDFKVNNSYTEENYLKVIVIKLDERSERLVK